MNYCIVSLLTPLAAIYVTTKRCRTPVFEILHSQKNRLFTIQLRVLLHIFTLAHYMSGMQNTQAQGDAGD
jgi:hypothetical protein